MDQQALSDIATKIIKMCEDGVSRLLNERVHVLEKVHTLKNVDKAKGKMKSGNGWINLLEEEKYRLIARTKIELGYYGALDDVDACRSNIVHAIGKRVGIKKPESSTALYVYADIVVLSEYFDDENATAAAAIHSAVLNGFRPIAWQGDIETGNLICSQ